MEILLQSTLIERIKQAQVENEKIQKLNNKIEIGKRSEMKMYLN